MFTSRGREIAHEVGHATLITEVYACGGCCRSRS